MSYNIKGPNGEPYEEYQERVKKEMAQKVLAPGSIFAPFTPSHRKMWANENDDSESIVLPAAKSFKPGDKVVATQVQKCTNFTRGKTYEVLKARNNIMEVLNDKGGVSTVRADRFEAVAAIGPKKCEEGIIELLRYGCRCGAIERYRG